LAIQIASQIGPNSDRIQAILRDVSIILMRHGLQNQTLTCTVQAQIVEMMFKCAKAFLNLNETTKTTEYIKDASQLLRTISGLSDERFTTLKYQLKLLQAELEWKSKSESSFYIVNTIISDCVEHLDGKEVNVIDIALKVVQKDYRLWYIF
jgi:hypothetical protein